MYVCDNCGRRCAVKELTFTFPNIPGLVERLDPGGVVPAGECPACGALVYPEDEPVRQQAHAVTVAPALVESAYACTDPDCSVNGRGQIEYRHGAVVTKVVALRFGRVMKPT